MEYRHASIHAWVTLTFVVTVCCVTGRENEIKIFFSVSVVLRRRLSITPWIVTDFNRPFSLNAQSPWKVEVQGTKVTASKSLDGQFALHVTLRWERTKKQ